VISEGFRYHIVSLVKGKPVDKLGLDRGRRGAVRQPAVGVRAWLAALAVTAALLPAGVSAKESPAAVADGVPTVALAVLPVQAQEVHRLILAGGPFQYAKDGTVFANRERLLPRQPRGFYREYTVPTPGASNRGARRIVCGGRQPASPDACYYTQDHYASFRRITTP
jgi:ribonuclease T1